MKDIVYDGSFEGLLSAIFQCYGELDQAYSILPEEQHQASLFNQPQKVATDTQQAERVLRALDEKTKGHSSRVILKLFLSETAARERLIADYIRLVMRAPNTQILTNFAHPVILKSTQIVKQIHREVHRMHAFVRFQRMPCGQYFALVEPDFDVLPLIGSHFEKRFADQKWSIVDGRRNYALHYDLIHCTILTQSDAAFAPLMQQIKASAEHHPESYYQTLWQTYFHAVNIRERNNPRLHLRHMPTRYWKYLIEKH